jgi:hypothetical protein
MKWSEWAARRVANNKKIWQQIINDSSGDDYKKLVLIEIYFYIYCKVFTAGCDLDRDSKHQQQQPQNKHPRLVSVENL